MKNATIRLGLMFSAILNLTICFVASILFLIGPSNTHLMGLLVAVVITLITAVHCVRTVHDIDRHHR